jgi:hypothetical protein
MRFFPNLGIAARIALGVSLSGSALIAQVLPDTTHQAPMVERYGKPYVMVTINGKGPFRFVIDTGTGGDALVTPELAAELGLPTVGHAMLSDPSGQGGKKAPIVRIPSLEIAGVQFNGIRAVSHPFFAEAGSCEGLLGFTLFRDYLLTLDFPDRFGSPPMQIFAITFDQKNLLVRFTANQKRFTLNAPPCPTRLTNAPVYDPPPPDLVPVG